MYFDEEPPSWDEEKFDRMKRKIRIRSQVSDELAEQLLQGELTWLATPLPLRTRLKLRLKRQFRKLNEAIAAIRRWNDMPR